VRPVLQRPTTVRGECRNTSARRHLGGGNNTEQTSKLLGIFLFLAQSRACA
jgi:hypothetical protein